MINKKLIGILFDLGNYMNKSKKKVDSPIVLKGNFLDAEKQRPLPKPTGEWPYHLDIRDVTPQIDILNDKMIFNVVGDTGSAKDLSFQKILAQQLIKQAKEGKEKPQFLYHLGDIVYDHGEAHEYPAQFFQPFENYPGPIFSIPGNHDAEINPLNQTPYNSLDAYMDVFCDSKQRYVEFSGGSKRKSMIQPNVYWTLNTPLATIIGLYGNVAKFGVINQEQRFWFIEELKKAAVEQGKVLIVCLHQSPFSADTNHGSSLAMIQFLENAYQEAGVKPDLVLGGHVHNYQRFTKNYPDGSSVPYVVAGAGGYAMLHSIAEKDGPNISADSDLLRDVTLENYCTAQYGFLKIKIVKKSENLFLTGQYFTVPKDVKEENVADNSTLFDQFEIRINKVELAHY